MQTYASVAPSRYVDAGSTIVGGAVVKLGAASNSIQAVAATSDKPLGVAQNTPDVDLNGTATDRVAVCVAGPATGLAGAAVSAGDSLQITAAGLLVPKSAAGYVVGEALTSAASGEYFDMLVHIRKEPA